MNSSFARLVAAATAAAALTTAACGPGRLDAAERYRPPAPLALVVLVDPAPAKLARELQQVEELVGAGATPGESVVVMMLAPSFGQSYTVLRGDNLSSIAAAHGITLAELESANPQLGPLSGRNWKLIHPSEQVMIPDGDAGAALLLVSKAPAGPTPPELVRLPVLPANPTQYQRAQYNRALNADTATNVARIAAWRTQADAALAPWRENVVAQLAGKAGIAPQSPRAPDGPMLTASMTAGLTTLQGLGGRRLLLLLGGGEIGPATLAPRSLAGVNLVIANVSDPNAAAAWKSAGTSAGAASVSALDPALTQLQLAQVVNAQSNQEFGQQTQGGT